MRAQKRRLLDNFRLLAIAVSGTLGMAGPPTLAAPPIAWQSIAKSTEGRPIEIAQFGEGARGYLVIGPLYGDARDAHDLIQRLAVCLSQSPPLLAGKRITLLRDPNPDGHSRGRLENARGVDLDRNFATSSWRQVSWGNRWVSGRVAESEAETAAVASLILILRPNWIVHVREARNHPLGPGGSLSAAGPAAEVAARIGRDAGLTLLPVDPAIHPGSLARFAAIDRRIPLLTFWSERGKLTPEGRESLFRGLVMALDLDTAASSGETTSPPATTVAPANPRILSVEQLIQGAPLAPVVSQRAAALRSAASRPTTTGAAMPQQVARPVPTAAQVHPAVVTEKTERPAPAPGREPERPIPVPHDEDLN
jgi:hypothetical protein